MTDCRGCVVVVAHICPFPAVHGNRSRLVALLKWFRTNGISVTYILQPLDVEETAGLSPLRALVDRLEVVSPPDTAAPARLWRFLRRALGRGDVQPAVLSQPWREHDAGPDHHIDRWCWPATCRAVEHAVRRDRPLAVLAEYALLSKCLLNLPPSVLKAIDTVEVFFRNRDRFQVDGLLASSVCSTQSETEALGRADLLVAIQKNDAEALRELFPTARVITVPHTYPQIPRHQAGPTRDTVLYVASSNPFNVHGLREFLVHAWPAIIARVPSATLRVIGSVPATDQSSTAGVVHVGRVTDAQLSSEYQTAHVVINPQVAGTGLKIKCVEALSAGCALVLNPAGADGLEDGQGEAFLVARDWPEFADQVVRILTEDTLRLSLEAKARDFARERFAPAAAFSPLTDAIIDAAHSVAPTQPPRG